jgi:hypothetical protein
MASSMPPNVPPGAASPNYPSAATLKQLSDANVATWLDIGRLAEGVEDYERAKTAYEMAIKNNHDSIPAKKAIALLYKDKLKSLDKVWPPFLGTDNAGNRISAELSSQRQPRPWRYLGIAWYLS